MPQWQTIIVVLIVAGAAFYLGRRFYTSLKKSGPPSCGCSCGCSGCSIEQSCEQIPPHQS